MKQEQGFTTVELVICLWGLVAVASLAAFGYVAVHFISKLW